MKKHDLNDKLQDFVFRVRSQTPIETRTLFAVTDFLDKQRKAYLMQLIARAIVYAGEELPAKSDFKGNVRIEKKYFDLNPEKAKAYVCDKFVNEIIEAGYFAKNFACKIEQVFGAYEFILSFDVGE